MQLTCVTWCASPDQSTSSTYIYFSEDSRATLCDLPIYIGSVPTEHLDSMPDKLKASLARICDEGIDMERMEMIINRDERQVCGDGRMLATESYRECSFVASWKLRRARRTPAT